MLYLGSHNIVTMVTNVLYLGVVVMVTNVCVTKFLIQLLRCGYNIVTMETNGLYYTALVSSFSDHPMTSFLSSIDCPLHCWILKKYLMLQETVPDSLY